MRVRAVPASETAVLASAVALRWSRPDLTAALAEHVEDVSTGDDRMWAAAAGWLVHGRAVVGDGRECASDALAELARRGAGLLDDPAADRLRIEVGLLAAGQCEPAMARLLVAPLLGADRSADVRADAFGVLARCVMEERPAAIGEATRRAEIAWGAVDGSHAELAGAALALLSAAALRRSGHPDSAVDRAEAGLARLDGLREGDDATPSQHLTAALGAEWITSLIEAGRTDEARAGCQPMVRQLQEATRPTRQIALLRLAVARALAESTSVGAVQALEQAAQDAAGCDTPDLEGLCLSTLGALREQSGRLDAALESMRRGVAAQRRDRARSERFRAALGAMSLGSPSRRTAAVARPLDRRERAAANLARSQAASNVIMAEGNLVEPVYPLAAGGEVNPWSTGHWADQRPMGTSGVVAFEPRVDNGNSASALAEGVSDEVAPDLDHEDIVEFFWGPAPARGGIEDIPVGREEGLAHSAYEGERWLEGALAELDRVWGQPLPDLDRSVGLTAEPAVAPTASGPHGNGHAVDHAVDSHAVNGHAVDGHAVDGHVVDGEAVDDPTVDDQDDQAVDGHLVDGYPVDGYPVDGHPVDGHAVGCVVVIDVVRAGASVPDVGEVLREVSDRLTQRIPAGGRLRCEVDESALSVVLPGRTRSAATDWMQQTLPGVFADMADLGGAQRWAAGTTLRAAVHDTDGPVGAQLLQRLDFVASRSPVTRAQHDVSPLAVVRWGVPILAGSGGRRRRPDDAADSERPAAHQAAAHQAAAHQAAAHQAAAHQAAAHPAAAHPAAAHPAAAHPAAAHPAAAHRPAAHQAETEVDDDGPEELEEDLGLAISYWDHESARRPAPAHLETSASDVPGRHWGSPWGPETSQSETRPTRAGELVGAAAALVASSPEPESPAELLPEAESPPPQQPANTAAPAPADTEFSVEGLGIADLLAGALAAYRGI